MTCGCQSIGAPKVVRFCDEHHAYHIGDKRLSSVSTVIRSIFPSSYYDVDPAVLENARERGIEVDQLFSRYVVGRLSEIPVGTRHDARDLFLKLLNWWDWRKAARSQVIVHDDEVAGTLDLWCDGWIYDLKTVSRIQPTYSVQLGIYAHLWAQSVKEPLKGLGIIHINKSMAQPRIVEVPMDEALQDAMTVRAAWSMLRRKGVLKKQDISAS